MKVRIFPSKAHGTVCAPPSKSVAHRALICGALSEGSTIYNLAMSEDIAATTECLEKFGAKVERLGDAATAAQSTEAAARDAIRIGGWSLGAIPEDVTVDCRESGSTLRFLIPFAMLSGRTVHFLGSERLMQRPLGIYREISERNGGLFELSGRGLTVRGGLVAGEYEVPGNISSPFLTGLMMALPLAGGDRLRTHGRRQRHPHHGSDRERLLSGYHFGSSRRFRGGCPPHRGGRP
mgnify:CR=1 FL=1